MPDWLTHGLGGLARPRLPELVPPDVVPREAAQRERPPAPGAGRRTALLLAAIFALAFGLRFAGNFLLVDASAGPTREDFSDGVEFHAIATNLVERGEFSIDPGVPTSFRAPGFPWLLAAIAAVAGPGDTLAARFVFCLVGALLTLATYALARQLADRRVALLASLLVAVYPNLAYYSLHYASEPLHTLLFTGALAALLAALREERALLALLAGGLLGLSALTRPLALHFAPFLALGASWWFRERRPRATRLAVLFLVATWLVVLPWTVRNALVHDRLLVIASNGGSTFWGANNALVLEDPALRGGWVTTNAMPGEKQAVRALTNEVDRDRLEWDYGKAFVREHPEALPRLVWDKWVEFWTPFCASPNDTFNLLVGLSYGALLPFMLGGAWLLARPRSRARPEALLLFLAVGLTVAGALVFYGSARFRSVIEPLLLVCAAVALVRLARGWPSRHGRTA